MKKTIKKETVKKATDLLELIEARKKAEKKEKDLKTFFKNLIGDNGAIQCEDILISIELCQRSDIDKAELEKVVNLDDYKTIKTFKKVLVKAC